MPAAKNILVISLAGIGDTLFATPFIHELRANLPSARIDVLVLWPGARDVLAGNPHLNQVYQKDLLQSGPAEVWRFLWRLRKNRYDVSFNTQPQSRIHYRIIARFVGARLRASHSYHQASRLDWLLVNRCKDLDYSRHSIDNNLDLLGFLGLHPVLPEHGYEIFLSREEIAWAEDWLRQQGLTGRRLLGIHVGSGGTKNLALRRWPLEHYRLLLQRLHQNAADIGVLLFGGPSEEEDNRQLLATADRHQVFHPITKSLHQAAALAKRCAAFLSVDTNLMHIAAAMKVPGQVVIETPTWNKPIEPYRQSFLLVPNPAVAGRNLEYYRYDGRGIQGTAEELVRCMASVRVEAVEEAVLRALASG